MAKKGDKILTQKQVHELGLDKVSVITEDILKGYTRIGNYAFKNCSSLTSITIPNSVTSIGWYAFYECSSLTSITIPNSVTRIREWTFYDCSGLTSIIIQNSITSIGYGAFSGCRSLISIEIPNSVTSIEDYTFYECSGLTSVTIPNSVTSIGNDAFAYCSGLTSVTIPNSVTNIGCNAFYGCRHLTSVTIGDKTYKKQTVTNGKCKAYKAFNSDMTCRYFQYGEGETYEFEGEPKLCACGFHACLRLSDVFNYYYGKLGKHIVIHEVKLEGVNDERNCDSKVVAKKITIGKRIL